MFRFEQLEIWKAAGNYGQKLYQITMAFPAEERFALADQLRRSAASISNNIAEGSGGTDKDFAKFLDIATKSTLETVNILYIATANQYIDETQRKNLYNEAEILVKRIRSFKKSLKS